MDEDTYTLFWITRKAMTIGTCLAVILSWEAHRSILWAILHGIFSWFYVAYSLL